MSQITPTILCFGEILFDCFSAGEYIGGAPFNLAAHAASCGCRATVYSRIGRDSRGAAAHHALWRAGVDARLLQIDDVHPTGYVDITLNASGEPTYRFVESPAWDFIESPSAETVEGLHALSPDAVVFGTLAQRHPVSRNAFVQLKRTLPNALLLYDVNLRPPHTPLSLVEENIFDADLLKLNESELDLISKNLWGTAHAPGEAFAKIREQGRLKALVVTKGSAGAVLCAEAGTFHSSAPSVKTISAVGAGDAFTAVFLVGWLKHIAPEKILERANSLGAWVAAHAEAVPPYPPDFQPF